MENRVAILSFIVENPNNVEPLNQLLHEFREHIIGRMGLPYKEKNISIICVAMDAPQDIISSLSGKVGRLEGISAKAVYSKQ
ncbi:MAG: iron-only hydrogenase system regulator [Clostridia bacterium]|nr:iron-only hydrogenase system regulator [Clostridia bacterium]